MYVYAPNATITSMPATKAAAADENSGTLGVGELDEELGGVNTAR